MLPVKQVISKAVKENLPWRGSGLSLPKQN